MGGQMGRALLRFFLMVFFMIVSSKSSGVMSVFDSSSYLLANKILSSSYLMINEAKHIGQNLDTLNTVIGKEDPFNFSVLAHKISQEILSLRGFSKTRFLIPGFETKKEDFSSLRTEFDRIFSGEFNQRGYMSQKSQEKISERRNVFFKDSVLTSLALVSSQKETLKSGVLELSAILKEADLARDLRSDISTTNRLLSMIVSEIIQVRALLIQHLEMNSAVRVRNLPILLEKRSLGNKSSPNLLDDQGRDVFL